MHRRGIAAVFCAIVLSIAASLSPARAEDVPKDPDAFTVFVADRLREDLPDYRVTIIRALTLKVVPPDGDSSELSLDRAHDYCTRQSAECAQWLEGFMQKMRATVKDWDAPIDRNMLRVVVRTRDYVEHLHKREELAIEPLTDDLVVLCYIDMPTAMRTAIGKDFTALGLSRAEALQQAKANLAGDLAAFEESFQDFGDDIGVIELDSYSSSWLALPDAWSATVARFGGKLIVAAPAYNTLLYARDTGSQAIDALRAAAKDESDRSEWPLSTSVYRWTPQGWKRM